MSGGITQLVAIGAQDAHLVGNPEVSFFRNVYKRHTNFAQVVDRQIIQGNPSSGGISTVRLERKGDMVSYVFLTERDSSGNAVDWGTASANPISKVELLIGGQVIDSQDNTFMTSIADPLLLTSVTKAHTSITAFLPLHFWFCENYQSALPLVALQYHDVEIRITWDTPAAAARYECFANFIYLDTDERREFANSPHELLIHQTQKSSGVSNKIHELNFNHPVKFLASDAALVSAPTDESLKLQINGVDVGNEKKHTPHFNIAPRYFHCTNLPNVDGDDDSFLYPFCLETSKLQPTGTLNFSRLDSVRIVSSGDMQSSSAVYAVNYNILRIQNGMGGVMYAN
jgi:hypothetical protein